VDPEVIKKETARFAQIWNEIIMSFRQEDLINDKYSLKQTPYVLCYITISCRGCCLNVYRLNFDCREKDLLLVPYSKDRELTDIIQWPPFLLASKVRTHCPPP
jgi:callose synthase